MFEDKTFESILSDMLTTVSELTPDVDVREGSIIYTALAPIALELETAYHEMDMIIDETFIGTASKEYLVKHGEQIGVELNEATYGHFKGEFDVDVEIGSRFNLDEFNYTVISKLSDPNEENEHYVFELVCETEGTEPNSYFGDLTPITYVPNLSYAKLTSVVIFGEDEEDTEAYRYRLQTYVKNQPFGTNVAQYEAWLDEYDGIGKHKTVPCWNGNNTVKLVILNSENKRANPELLNEVQNYFDPPTSTINDNTELASYPQGRGMGNGQAPIGAIVTVDTVTEVPVTIQATLKLKEGYSTPVGVVEGVEKYLNSLVLNKTTIGYMPISAEVYNAESVDEVISLYVYVKDVEMSPDVSPFIDSVTIGDNEIPVLDDLSNWSVQQ